MPQLIRCPSCNATVQVPDERLGLSVRCGGCDTVFTATATAAREPENYVRPETSRPSPTTDRGRRPGYDDYDEDFDDRYFDIRRRRRISRSRARSKVAG